MKKFFSTLFFLVIIALGLLWVFRANIASHWISQHLGVNVVFEQFNPTPWGLNIKGTTFHHPETKTTLKIGQLSLQTPFLGLFDKKIIVEKLELNDITVISKPGKVKINSLDSLLKIADIFNSNQPKIQNHKSTDKREFVIKEMIATNVNVEIDNPLGKGALLKTNIPSIKLKNINQGDAITLQNLLNFLSKTFLKQASENS